MSYEAALRQLQAKRIPFILTGAVAMGVYGVQRSTADIDLCITIDEGESARAAMREAGFTPRRTRPAEMTADAGLVHHLVGPGGSVFQIDLIEFETAKFRRLRKRARHVEWPGVGRVLVIGLEDLIAHKAIRGSAVDREDIRILADVMKYPKRSRGDHGP